MSAIFPTAYLPSIAYFATLAKQEELLIEQFETFPKQTIRNRAVIQMAAGKMPLIVPIIRTNGNHTLTKDIQISYAENWNVQHWRSIETAYNSSPYFLYYKDGIEKILQKRFSFLLDLNQELLDYLLSKVKLHPVTSHTKSFVPQGTVENDFRSAFTIKKECDLYNYPPYDQVFNDRQAFLPDLSIVDILFNIGPDTTHYLKTLQNK